MRSTATGQALFAFRMGAPQAEGKLKLTQHSAALKVEVPGQKPCQPALRPTVTAA
ncbi:MAG TPA: hypothetical protein VGK29_03185 [Paludibaculum sp.]